MLSCSVIMRHNDPYIVGSTQALQKTFMLLYAITSILISHFKPGAVVAVIVW